MPIRWGPGPVFAAEWLIASRRWQVYAARSLFVALLLAGLAMVVGEQGGVARDMTIRPQGALVQAFFSTILGVQLTLVLLMATSATFDRCLGRAATHTILGTPVTGTRPARRPRRPAMPLPPG